MIFSAVMTGGTPTFPTGYKQGAFSITLNQRNPTRSSTGYLANIGWMASGYAQVASVLRETLEKCENYTCALAKLQNDYTSAPVYFILAGIKDYEGVVISRDQDGPVKNGLQFLDQNTWYLVQTNQDHFKGDCPERCTAANNNFKSLGQDKATVTSVFDEVLNVAPNLNSNSIYTTVMIPSAGLFLTEIANGTYIATDL
jgi:hypothetical protein